MAVKDDFMGMESRFVCPKCLNRGRFTITQTTVVITRVADGSVTTSGRTCAVKIMCDCGYTTENIGDFMDFIGD